MIFPDGVAVRTWHPHLLSILSILCTLQGHVKILEMLLATADAEMEERVQPAGPPELQKIGNQLKEIGEGGQGGRTGAGWGGKQEGVREDIAG